MDLTAWLSLITLYLYLINLKTVTFDLNLAKVFLVSLIRDVLPNMFNFTV